MIKTRYAESLPEIYQHINSIGREVSEKEKGNPIMWFRGHARASYILGPSIFRKADYQYNRKQTYSDNHLREDYRFQSFMSRNYDNVMYRMPQTVIEWQEVMQHFFTKTRLMDWSESLIVALEFALEAFITPNKDLEIQEQCRRAEPVIWVLEPTSLNKSVYRAFVTKEKLIRKALGKGRGSLAKEIRRELEKEEESGIYYNLQNEQERNINAIIGLSPLEMIRNSFQGRELEALESFEMNPFFYLLLRYYSDGVPVEVGEISPLAIIHPYHSQKIKIQKGVFTVFPYYIPDKCMEEIKELNGGEYPPVGMEYMEQCRSCLHRIRITNPQKVAKELMLTGVRRGNIYPDIQVMSQDMENVVVP